MTVPAVACRETIGFEFRFVDASGQSASAFPTLELGQDVTDVLLQDTFETDQGWFPDPTGPDLFGGVWQRGDPVGSMVGGELANPELDSPFDAGSGVADTATLTESPRPLSGPDEYYLVTAVNAAGPSGDEPAD